MANFLALDGALCIVRVGVMVPVLAGESRATLLRGIRDGVVGLKSISLSIDLSAINSSSSSASTGSLDASGSGAAAILDELGVVLPIWLRSGRRILAAVEGDSDPALSSAIEFRSEVADRRVFSTGFSTLPGGGDMELRMLVAVEVEASVQSERPMLERLSDVLTLLSSTEAIPMLRDPRSRVSLPTGNTELTGLTTGGGLALRSRSRLILGSEFLGRLEERSALRGVGLMALPAGSSLRLRWVPGLTLLSRCFRALLEVDFLNGGVSANLAERWGGGLVLRSRGRLAERMALRGDGLSLLSLSPREVRPAAGEGLALCSRSRSRSRSCAR